MSDDPLDQLADLIDQPPPGVPVDEFGDDPAFIRARTCEVIKAERELRAAHKRAGGRPRDIPPGRFE